MHHLLVEDSAEKFGFFYCCWASLQPGLEVFMIMDCMWWGGGGGGGFRALQISVVLEDALGGDSRGASGMMIIIRCRRDAKW